ncbi:TVA3 protein, partial [Polyodon spathula]|nr:TVA3 protein [Polyodon spathula]
VLLIVPCFLCFNLETSQGQSVNQSSVLTVKEEGHTTIPCSYKDATLPFLFWYIQNHNLAPQILYYENIDATSVPASFRNRISAKHDNNKKTFDLQITRVLLSDSSVFLCALNPTV